MTIKILFDENLDPQAAVILRTQGYNAETVSEFLGLGSEDREIAEYANRNEMVIATNDRDFLNLDVKQGVPVLMFGSDDTRAIEIVELIVKILESTESRNDLPPVMWL